MGRFIWSMHFKCDDAGRVRSAAEAVVAAVKGAMFVAPVIDGWVSAYPSSAAMKPDVVRQIAAKAKVDHALAFSVEDSDVLTYWYFRHGKLIDSFNSCPDYYGKPLKSDLAAVGDSSVFSELLDKAGQNRLSKLIARRLIDGDYVGDGPDFDFEEERLGEIAKLLKIKGALGEYDDIASGSTVPGVASAEQMAVVGAISRRSSKPKAAAADKVTFTLNAIVLKTDATGKLAERASKRA